MDVAGTTSAASSPMTIVINTQTPPAPQVTGSSTVTGSSGSPTAQDLTVTGTAQADNLVTVLLNGIAVGTALSGSNGAWTYNNPAMTLANGNISITAVAENIAGTFSNVSAAFNTTVETVASPVIAGVSLVTGTQGLHRNQQGLSIVGTAPPNNQVQVDLGGTLLGTVTANSQGGWSYTYAPTSTTVPSGTYAFSAVAVDQWGNTSAMSPTFLLEVGGGPTAGTPQYASGVLSGQATPGSLVTIVDGDVIIGVVMASASGTWQFTPTLTNGTNSIMVEATDSSGDTSLLSTAITVS